jgi:hypothetical protein
VTEEPTPDPFVPQAPSRRPYLGLVAVALVFVLPALVLMEYAGRNAYDFDWRLSKDPVTTTARATDFREIETNSNKTHSVTHELRYAFKVKGDDTTYRATSSSMFDQGDDLWIDVPEHVWDDARDSGELKVEYLKSDPAVNQPVKAHRGSITSIVFTIVGLIMLALGLVLLRGALRPLWRGRNR